MHDQPHASGAELQRTLRDACRALLALHDDPGSDAVAHVVMRRFNELDEAGRVAFFEFLLDDLAADRTAIGDAIEGFHADPSPATVVNLREAATSPRITLFNSINAAPGGIRGLLDMRSALLEAVRENRAFAPVDADLSHLLSLWFNRGFLELVRLDWTTSAGTLEKLIEYEAVHEIQGWGDLRRRLDDVDRRIFAYFHPALPGDPVIFVEVALTRGLASSIQELLAHRADEPHPEPDTAIFYSITNCQPGLRGVSFGNVLIKKVAATLATEMPHVTTFSTLSPVPGFRRWLDDPAHAVAAGLSTSDRAKLRHVDEPGWLDDEILSRRLRPCLERACARYLVNERRGTGHDAAPLDPVARFHLRNGARLERINWAGDTSGNGVRQSAGILVNYVYDFSTIDVNQDRLVNEGVVARSVAIDRLLDQ